MLVETIGPLLCSIVDVLYLLHIADGKIIVHGGIDESSHLILSLSAANKATTVVYGFLCVVNQYGVPSRASTVEMLRVLSPKKQTN